MSLVRVRVSAGRWLGPDDAADYVQTGSRAVVHQVEEQPLTAMLIAGATGYLLAYLIDGEHSSWSEEQLPDYARRR